MINTPTWPLILVSVIIISTVTYLSIKERNKFNARIYELEQEKITLQLELKNYQDAFTSAIDSADNKQELNKRLEDVQRKNDTIRYNIDRDSLFKLWADRYGTRTDTAD